jgi:hypothetical protein
MPASTGPTRSYVALTLTLTLNTTTNLLKALQAALTAAEGGTVPATGHEITIQNDPNSGFPLYVGDASIATSTQRCGYILGAGQSKTYRSSGPQNCPVGAIFLRATGAAVVNVEVWC